MENKIPENYQAVMPYIIVNDAKGFMDFMKSVFDAKEQYKEMDNESKKIRHAELNVKGSTIMFTDATDDWGVENSALFIYVDDADKAYNKAVELGAKSIMPLENKEYGRTGGVKDPYGNTWWITQHLG